MVRAITTQMSDGLKQAVLDWVKAHCPFPATEELIELKKRLESKSYISLAAQIGARPYVVIGYLGEEYPRFELYWEVNLHGSDDTSKAIIRDFLNTRDFRYKYHREILPEGIGEIRQIECNPVLGHDYLYCLESEIAKLHAEAIKEASQPFQAAKRYSF